MWSCGSPILIKVQLSRDDLEEDSRLRREMLLPSHPGQKFKKLRFRMIADRIEEDGNLGNFHPSPRPGRSAAGLRRAAAKEAQSGQAGAEHRLGAGFGDGGAAGDDARDDVVGTSGRGEQEGGAAEAVDKGIVCGKGEFNVQEIGGPNWVELRRGDRSGVSSDDIRSSRRGTPNMGRVGAAVDRGRC